MHRPQKPCAPTWKPTGRFIVFLSNVLVYRSKPSISCLDKATDRNGCVKVIQGVCHVVQPGRRDEYRRWLLIVATARLNEGIVGWESWLSVSSRNPSGRCRPASRL